MGTFQSKPATLALADGTLWHGQSVGAAGTVVAELIFNTATTGYQEILTDPSNTGQFICFTAPQIGNVGVSGQEAALPTFHASGVVMRQMARKVSHPRSVSSLADALAASGLVAISDLDTRALVRWIREHGATNAVISTEYHEWAQLQPYLEGAIERDAQVLVDMSSQPERVLAPIGSTVADTPVPAGVDGSDGTPTGQVPAHPFTVALIAFGESGAIAHLLTAAGCEVHCLSPATDAGVLVNGGFDGVVIGHGPGNPALLTEVITTIRQCLDARIPLFGIGLGHQLLALAAGGTITRMAYGHHGGNHPVRNLVSDSLGQFNDPGEWLPVLARDGKAVEITGQNQLSVVDADSLDASPYGPVIQSHVNLTDGSNAGIAFRDRPAFSVQYHPQGAPGPHDSRYLFDQFTAMMAHHRTVASTVAGHHGTTPAQSPTHAQEA